MYTLFIFFFWLTILNLFDFRKWCISFNVLIYWVIIFFLFCQFWSSIIFVTYLLLCKKKGGGGDIIGSTATEQLKSKTHYLLNLLNVDKRWRFVVGVHILWM